MLQATYLLYLAITSSYRLCCSQPHPTISCTSFSSRGISSSSFSCFHLHLFLRIIFLTKSWLSRTHNQAASPFPSFSCPFLFPSFFVRSTVSHFLFLFLSALTESTSTFILPSYHALLFPFLSFLYFLFFLNVIYYFTSILMQPSIPHNLLFLCLFLSTSPLKSYSTFTFHCSSLFLLPTLTLPLPPSNYPRHARYFFHCGCPVIYLGCFRRYLFCGLFVNRSMLRHQKLPVNSLAEVYYTVRT